MRREFDSLDVERKWLERWRKADLYAAQRGSPGDKKFFLHFAYPGISGFLHVGHMRGFTYSDVFTRFHRMTGHRVLFPAGFHASGIPSVGLARRVERGEAATLEYLKNNGCPPEQIPKLKDPQEVVRYFSQVYADDYWRRFGYLIDWRTLCTTIDPGYNRFIQWQFKQLQERKLLVQKPHYAPFCPVDGAVAVDASETDISKGGSAEIQDFTLVLYRLPNGDTLPCATLRPETTFGVTNLWINPDATYKRIAVGGGHWILSDVAAQKIAGQRNDVKDSSPWTATLAVDLLKEEAINPLTGARVPILPASFVDPARATGVVMSVPAHAPYDWQALQEIRPEIQPIVIIRNPNAKGVPAAEAAKRHGAKGQADKAALDAATEEVYSEEFHHGEMLPAAGALAGLKVRDAKEKVKALLENQKALGAMQDFDQDVVCRCGNPVHIRQVPDQWFIHYSDQPLTDRSKEHAASMRIFPEEYRRDMPGVLDWFGDRACIRRGSWLGTEFPFKATWIIEPISDSTLYPAYYIVSPYVNSKRLRPEELTDAFFDFVFLGKGKPEKPVWAEVRKDFQFWYPVDINLGGKEHKTVHFPPYVMNHVAILPPEKWPRGIFVNWWVTQKAGAKISKSKGGAEPIPGAAQKYSVDAMRFYYCNVASAHVDIEWDPEIVLKYRSHVERLFQFVMDWAQQPKARSPGRLDAWLRSTWAERFSKSRAAFERFDLRAATQQAYFEFYNDLQWFLRRGGQRSDATDEVLREWVLALTPVTPFVAEELWEALGRKGLASAAQLPLGGMKPERDVIAAETFLQGVIDDVGAIARVTGRTPQRIIIYTAPEWKRSVFSHVLAAVREGERNPGNVIKSLMARPELKVHAKEVAAFVPKAFKDALDRASGEDGLPRFDEHDVLLEAAPFLTGALNVTKVEVFRADDAAAPDPGKKRGAAAPFKPALYME
ncbi:MAG: leucine--tRNA ligase [Euryarchaeota archaeon]|nr:leucine--tRNA ligase [Euryarchaeota archaeon]